MTDGEELLPGGWETVNAYGLNEATPDRGDIVYFPLFRHLPSSRTEAFVTPEFSGEVILPYFKEGVLCFLAGGSGRCTIFSSSSYYSYCVVRFRYLPPARKFAGGPKSKSLIIRDAIYSANKRGQ